MFLFTTELESAFSIGEIFGFTFFGLILLAFGVLLVRGMYKRKFQPSVSCGFEPPLQRTTELSIPQINNDGNDIVTTTINNGYDDFDLTIDVTIQRNTVLQSKFYSFVLFFVFSFFVMKIFFLVPHNLCFK